MEWTQHGQYRLSWQGDILIAHYSGAWNEVAVRNLHRDARALWQQHGGQSWGMLSDLRDWDGATPEALTLWWVFFEDAVQHGMRVVTDILPSHFHEAMVKELAERAGRLATYCHHRELQPGLDWLAAQGLRTA